MCRKEIIMHTGNNKTKDSLCQNYLSSNIVDDICAAGKYLKIKIIFTQENIIIKILFLIYQNILIYYIYL